MSDDGPTTYDLPGALQWMRFTVSDVIGRVERMETDISTLIEVELHSEGPDGKEGILKTLDTLKSSIAQGMAQLDAPDPEAPVDAFRPLAAAKRIAHLEHLVTETQLDLERARDRLASALQERDEYRRDCVQAERQYETLTEHLRTLAQQPALAADIALRKKGAGQ